MEQSFNDDFLLHMDSLMRNWLSIGLVLLIAQCCCAQWTKTIEQVPALSELPDATTALQEAIDAGGSLRLTEKFYRLTQTLEIDLTKHGAVTVESTGGATLIMQSAGPAIRFLGSHQGTASPKSFKPTTWNQRMPIIRGIEILGAHAEADGIELRSTVGAIVNQFSVRWCQHGIHLVDRNRNVVISDCHLYENSGVGLFLNDVNLHQINVSNSHISYNRSGGIVVRDGNVRNLQVSGCDIEGNMPGDDTPTKTANVLIDVSGSADDKSKSIAEIAITGCTVQHSANYSNDENVTVAPGGANIRLAGKAIYPINSVTISGNVLSDTTTNVDIHHAHDVIVTGNTFFAPKPDNLTIANSQRVIVSSNTFNPRQFVRPGTIRLIDSENCLLANLTIHKFATDQGAIILQRCSNCQINAVNLSDCGSGIVLKDSRDISITNCRASGSETSLDIDESNSKVLLNANSFEATTK